MSIFGAMRTSVSGMNAQSNRLSALSENIANADTTGYKANVSEFETLLNDQSVGAYSSGGVDTRMRYAISQQGLVQNAAGAASLAIQGQGFFVVSDASGAPHLTRAGAFAPNAQGELVNTAGYKLMGVDLSSGAGAAAPVGFGAMSLIQVDTSGLIAAPSAAGVLSTNLPSAASVVAAANLPSANAATSTYSAKTSVVAYDNIGAKTTLDVYYAKTGPNAWEATVYNQADAAPGGGFPYSSGPLATKSLAFDPASGALAAGSASALSVTIPNGGAATLDLGATTQLAADFTVTASTIDGHAPAAFSQIQVGSDGIVSAVYANGVKVPKYRVALASVAGPDNLTPRTGNVYDVNEASGTVSIGAAGTGGRGSIVAGALESSTVDIATELTNMIQTQRSYTANSKAFQIGTDMADALFNLKV